jgi:hypothetical protein
MNKTQLSVCLAADMGFAPKGLSMMVSALLGNRASVVYASSITYDYSDICKNNIGGAQVRIFDILPRTIDITHLTQPGHEIVKEYFSYENICGEYNNFSFFGSLIYSPILVQLTNVYSSFRFHGSEHYLSMDLAINAPLVTRLRSPCILGVVNTPRIGGTERPSGHYTRFEPIFACDVFLKNKYAVLSSHYMDMTPFFISQREKCKFFKENYTGYENEIEQLYTSALREKLV